LKNPAIKQLFSVKKKEELKELSYEELLKYVENLTDNLVQEKPKKDSTNSSKAPSSDMGITPNKNQSLRTKSEKSSGGQFGHKGKTLMQSKTPNEIVELEYRVSDCKECGNDLTTTIAKLKEKRQVLDLDISAIQTQITQYQSYSKICNNCGYDNHDNSYPVSVTPYISYGANIMAIVSYLSTVHYLSYNRIVSAMKSLYSITISEGTVDTIIKRSSKYSEVAIDKIKQQLKLSDVMGIDETGCKVNGQRYWHWTFQNDKNTLIVANKSRGTKVITETFEDGFVNACVVHDNYSSYSTLVAKDEQLCLAHKLRDLNYAIACDDTQVMKDIKLLIQEAMLDHKEKLLPHQRKILKEQYLNLLDLLLKTTSVAKSQTQKQLKSFLKARDKIFTFLLHPSIPPDNNGSERAIRNVKVKLKVSGQFKSEQGAICYANLRSIVDTSRKRGLNEFEALRNIISGVSIF
jgi:UDP-N-acetylglucosamine transferase subunit ALG13